MTFMEENRYRLGVTYVYNIWCYKAFILIDIHVHIMYTGGYDIQKSNPVQPK